MTSTHSPSLFPPPFSQLDSDCDEDRSLLEPEHTGTNRVNSGRLGSTAGREGEQHGEATARASRRLLRGFFSYSIASEVFSIVSLGLFLPVALEQMSRENGYLAPEHSIRCPPSSDALGPGSGDTLDGQRCAVNLLGAWIDTASFSLFVYSASVALQAIGVISLGALADHPRTRHRLLTTFATTGALFTLSFPLFPSSSPVWFLSAVLALGANVSFGASMVCLNSYLPELGRRNPAVLRKLDEVQDATEALKHIRSSSTPTGNDLLVASQDLVRAQESFVMERAIVTSQVSSTAVAAGYASGIFCLILLLVPVTLSKGSTFALQCAISASGAWWAIGSIPASIWLRPPQDTLPAPDLTKQGYLESAREGWRGLGRMLLEWRRLPSTFVFLSAWFLLSDAFATLTSTAMLFGKTSLGMSTSSLVVIAVISPTSGIAGAILFPRLQKTFLLWSNLQILQLLVVLACLIPLWGLLALRSQWQMYCLAVVFGGLYGSFQSYARSCFSELVPPSQAARWFGLFSITDKSSSFLGPLLVALVTNETQEIRHGFFLILGMLVLALPILAKVDMDKGRSDADEYERGIVERLIVAADVEEDD